MDDGLIMSRVAFLSHCLNQPLAFKPIYKYVPAHDAAQFGNGWFSTVRTYDTALDQLFGVQFPKQ